ncbi:histidinol-phosphatase [Emcibacter sp.]|uniref:histidinol-phosphatase n=1 Tax=Emcibacter sp. TaxID=1979954 RepID=UPI002AA7AD72|nr:histidinol-phosphatase [Emcibacter sp.]
MSDNLNPDEIKEYVDFLQILGNAAAEITLKSFRAPLEVSNKGRKLQSDFDPVTRADRDAEEVIRRLIHEKYPAHNLIGEEHGHDNFSESTDSINWIIDPIDGTRSFIAGIPLWGTLVAVNDGTKPVIGMMDQPYLKERYIGSPLGSTLNGAPIRCRACPDVSLATLSTTDPVQLFATDEDRKAFERVAKKANMVRNGYDCYAYMMVASGHMDVVIESGLESYDIQPLIPIIENAGGVVTSWDGSPANLGGQVVACGDRALHKQVLDILNS